MESAQSFREDGEADEALDALHAAIYNFPKYEPAYHLMLRILLEENYQPSDVLWVLKQMEKTGRLGPKNRLQMGIEEFKLGNFQKALPLLDQALSLQPDLLEEWDHDPEAIEGFAFICRENLDRLAERHARLEKPAKKKARPAKVEKVEKKTVPSAAGKRADEPSRRPTEPEETPRTVMSTLVEEPSELVNGFALGSVSRLSMYLLAQEASEINQAERFESLLCLSGLRGVTRYSYQIETVRKVLRSFRGRVLLADEVGLGKTIEAGMVLREYILRGMVKKALILTPPALVSQWCEELISKFSLSPVSTDHPEVRRDAEGFWKKHDLIVASLALARNKRHRPILSRIGFDLVVVDEAHHVKNHLTAGWKLVDDLRSRFLLLITATPVENNLMDLYNLVTLLKPGQLRTRASFKREFVLRGDPTQPRNREHLRELVGEVIIRNTRALADIKLPPRHATTVLVKGEPSERELYRRLADLVRECYRRDLSRLSLGLLLQEAGSSPRAVRRTLLKMARRPEIDSGLADQMAKLAKLCDYAPDTAKTARLLDLLRACQDKVLVFSRFTATLEELAQSLTKAGVAFSSFTGRMSAAEKDAAVDALRDGVDVMLCSEIGGEGRNLQFCSTMVNFDLPWNPMKIEQRIGRIHRIGQTRPVHVYNLCAQDTAEQHILEVLDRRINMFELVIGEVDLILGQMKDECEFDERILAIYGESQNESDVGSAFERLGDELLTARHRYDKIKQLDDAIFSNDYEV